MRTTVAIPLHAGARWIDVVRGNLDRLSSIAHVVVSDVTGVDDCLALLRSEYEFRPNIEFLPARLLPRGWVAHCNDLLERASTEFFMWLSQDDEIDADWVSSGERILDQDADVSIAMGAVEGFVPHDLLTPISFTRLDGDDHADPDPVRRARWAVHNALRGDPSLLGICFRGVVRVSMALPLPGRPESGEWVDVLWAVSMLGRGRVESNNDVVYRKRLYPSSEHKGWKDIRKSPEFRSEHLVAALGSVDVRVRESALAHAWADEVDLLQSQLDGAVGQGEDRELVAVGKSSVDATPGYETELTRLWNLPTGTPAATSIMGFPMRLADGPSFAAQYREIFVAEAYSFTYEGSSPVIIDAGANVGTALLWWRARWPESRIVAFEPDPNVFELLEFNTRFHERLDLRLEALSTPGLGSSFLAEGTDAGRLTAGTSSSTVTVATADLAEVIEELGHVDLLKLDIEGAETEVLLDASEHLRWVDRMFVEYHSFTDQPQRLDDLLQLLSVSGFRWTLASPPGRMRPFETDLPPGAIDAQADIWAWRPATDR